MGLDPFLRRNIKFLLVKWKITTIVITACVEFFIEKMKNYDDGKSSFLQLQLLFYHCFQNYKIIRSPNSSFNFKIWKKGKKRKNSYLPFLIKTTLSLNLHCGSITDARWDYYIHFSNWLHLTTATTASA